MLLALTVERYVSVCHPGQHTRPLCGPPHLTVVLIPLATFVVYLPSVFRGEITKCHVAPVGPLIYQKRDNLLFMHSVFYQVSHLKFIRRGFCRYPALPMPPNPQVYKVVLEVVFKVAPTILLAGFNLRIMIVYRRSCERRRRMTLSRTVSSDEDPRTFAEERRLVLLLGSTSILFLVCVTPMVILNVTLSEPNLSLYPYQVSTDATEFNKRSAWSITFFKFPSGFQSAGQSARGNQLFHHILHLLPVLRGFSKHPDTDPAVAMGSCGNTRTQCSHETFSIAEADDHDHAADNGCSDPGSRSAGKCLGPSIGSDR